MTETFHWLRGIDLTLILKFADDKERLFIVIVEENEENVKN